MSTAPYVAFASVLDRIHTWWTTKRTEWEMDRLLLDQVAAGWVPDPAMVGINQDQPIPYTPTDAGWGWLDEATDTWHWTPAGELVFRGADLPEPDPVEESRPVDLHDCGRCGGQGMTIESVDGESGYRLCSWCTGTGQRGAA